MTDNNDFVMHLHYHAGPGNFYSCIKLVALDDFCLQDCSYLNLTASKLYNILTLDVKQLKIFRYYKYKGLRKLDIT